MIKACGTHKQYSKIFKERGIEDSLPKQVDCLKRILHDLGMKGRMGMEQAKTIREEKELAQELGALSTAEPSIVTLSLL